MPGGRPSNIDTVIRTTEEGRDVTVADDIVNALRAGSYFEPAALAAGTTKTTAYGWLKRAGALRIEAAAHGGNLDALPLNPHDRSCIAFSDAVREARAQWEIGALATLERLARGGIERVRTVKKVDAQGNVLETTETTEHTLPDAKVLIWRLERAFPDTHGGQGKAREGDVVDNALGSDDRVAALERALADRKLQIEVSGEVAVTRARRKRRTRRETAGEVPAPKGAATVTTRDGVVRPDPTVVVTEPLAAKPRRPRRRPVT